MRDVVDDVDTRHILLLQEVHRLAFLFAEYRHQYVGTGHFFAARRLHVENRALQHALKTKRRLCFPLGVAGRNQRSRRFDELMQLLAQAIDVGADRLQHVDRHRVVEQCEQQMLDRHPLVALGSGFLECKVQGDFEIFAQHRVGT